ncbi:MAG: protein-disulfide reductase DsbD domain-containing protein [Pseudomonadota bacterium]
MELKQFIFAVAALVTLLVGNALAQETGPQVPLRAENLVSHELISESQTLVPGQTHWIALRQTIASGWHTYWENAGDAGGPTQLEWVASEQIAISPIHWPTPKIIPYQGLISHAYEDEALLLLQVKVPTETDAQSVELTARINYLVCADICIPGSGSASLQMPVAASSGPSADAAAIQKARALLPGPIPFSVSLTGNELTISGAGIRPQRITQMRFLPSAPGVLDHNVDQPIQITQGAASLTLTAKNGPSVPSDLSGLLLVTEKAGERASATVSQGFIIAAGNSTYTNGGAPIALPGDAIRRSGVDWSGLAVAMGFALLGGLILNLMPCVFPILSIKAMAIAKSGGRHGTAERTKALAFFGGVMVSFALLGALFLGLRASGAALGWGFQFQSPAFVAAMAALFFALALNMFGLFEIRTSFAGTGDRLTRHDGPTGSFFTGALATLAATPCTAPFMGAALGYALAQPAAIAMAVILMLGLGFATPMTLLGLSRRFAALLPRPGAWMETLRKWLAVPLLATVVWLGWILWLQTGAGGTIILVSGLIAMALALTLVGRGKQASSRALGTMTALMLGIGVSWAATTQIPAVPIFEHGGEAQWSPARVEELRASGTPVFVDFTAAWCITCKVNEAAVINTESFRQLLVEHNGRLLVADWTVQDPRITAVLERHGRAGVPLYLLYPAHTGQADQPGEPTILPQILTVEAVSAAFDKL